ncbi:hypothetical protein ACVWXL_004047 [Bradyrhizobium sp. GM22.5]
MTAQASATAAPRPSIAAKTPPLPESRPETLGLSRPRLETMSDAFKREIDKGNRAGRHRAGGTARSGRMV